jgi:anti-sigma B factor antagonist
VFPVVPHFALVEEQVDGGIDVAAVSGEIHVSTAPRFRYALEAIIDSGDGALVLDLSDVVFIDSTGLSVLLTGLRQISQRGGNMVLVCKNPTVLRLFQITSLDSTFEIVPDRPTAIARVSGD